MKIFPAITLISTVLALANSEAENDFGISAYRQSVDIDLPSDDKQTIKIAFGSCYGIRDHKSDIFEAIG